MKWWKEYRGMIVPIIALILIVPMMVHTWKSRTKVYMAHTTCVTQGYDSAAIALFTLDLKVYCIRFKNGDGKRPFEYFEYVEENHE